MKLEQSAEEAPQRPPLELWVTTSPAELSAVRVLVHSVDRLRDKGREVTVRLDAEGGSVRDPMVHYDGDRILFSWRKKGSPFYNLYEMDVDSRTIRQLTFGCEDDFDPCPLPSGDVVFMSSRRGGFCRCGRNFRRDG